MTTDINRRVTRTNSSDATSIAAGIYHPPYSHEYIHRSGSFMKLKKQLNRQLFAVKKLISTLDELPIVETDNSSPNSPDYSERSRLITPFFSHRPIGSYINNNSQYGYGSISPETLGETSFSFTD